MNLLETLLAVEMRRRDAWLSRDKAALASLLDEDFFEINYFGRLSKSRILNDLFDRLELQEFTMQEPMLHGETQSPILSYYCFERLRVDGTEIEGHFQVASHFRWRDPDWKILLWQITPRQTG